MLQTGSKIRTLRRPKLAGGKYTVKTVTKPRGQWDIQWDRTHTHQTRPFGWLSQIKNI